ncbi:MAG TPA: alpha/beta hydrolase-fold protein [Chitinophagaceae bacterium]|nr:alpha/beta hydrolase-fold protein [Chitinophagaceae bacterium]
MRGSFPIFESMEVEKGSLLLIESALLESQHLQRQVTVEFYLPLNVPDPEQMSLLLINDGQDMVKFGFAAILEELYEQQAIRPILCAAIHAGEERKMEYGTAGIPDYKGRGAKAGLYTNFIFEELLPYIRTTYKVESFHEKVFAGFSLGGLSALDIVWKHPHEFSCAGVFSASLWWRTRDQDDEDYSDDNDRIMHQQIRHGDLYPWLRFFIQCGAHDEEKDRNNNGVIDSIDDAMDLIKELKAKGYPDENICYVLLEDGKHDVESWGKAMPLFLRWQFGSTDFQV